MEFQQNFPVDKLIPYARNSRTHNDEQVAQIMASIKEFGFTNPILIGSDNVIIAGHGRFLAAQRLGMTEVPVIVLPDLTETQRRALVIADNRIALNAGWDEKMLALEIGELKDEDFDLTNLGFTDDELKALENFGEIQDTGNTEDDEVPEAPVEPTSKHGDVWQLGNHRLMCGDTTMIDDFKKLMQNDVADMIFTDPPYNVNYGATMKDKLRYHTSPNHGRTIMNDNLGEDFEQFLYDACTNMLMYCKGAAYVCMSSSELHTLYSAFVKAGGKWSTFIIWAKNTFTLGRADYQRQYEPKGGYSDEHEYRQVVEITADGQPTLYADPSGSSYCRYLGIEVNQKGKTMTEILKTQNKTWGFWGTASNHIEHKKETRYNCIKVYYLLPQGD